MDDRREHPQQDAGVVPLEAEETSDAGDVAAPVPEGDAPGDRPLVDRPEVDRRVAEFRKLVAFDTEMQA